MTDPFLTYVWQRVPELAVERYKAIEPQVLEIWAKQANWPRRALELSQVLPASTPLPLGIPSRPSPLLGMLVGGLAGGGLGYGLGYLGEKLLPESWHRGRLRRSGAMLGAGLGAAPGASLALWNVVTGRPINDTSLTSQIGYDYPQAAKVLDDYWQEQDARRFLGGPQLEYQPRPPAQAAPSPLPAPEPPALTPPEMELPDLDERKKWAAYGGAGVSSIFSFDPDEFNEMIWSDPRLSGRLEPPVQAAASGLVTGAANLPGKSTRFVTPLDIGRIAAGMGSGYLSGMLVGKALGVLMGMPDTTQDKLKNTGAMAGLIANLVPIAFGG